MLSMYCSSMLAIDQLSSLSGDCILQFCLLLLLLLMDYNGVSPVLNSVFFETIVSLLLFFPWCVNTTIETTQFLRFHLNAPTKMSIDASVWYINNAIYWKSYRSKKLPTHSKYCRKKCNTKRGNRSTHEIKRKYTVYMQPHKWVFFYYCVFVSLLQFLSTLLLCLCVWIRAIFVRTNHFVFITVRL